MPEQSGKTENLSNIPSISKQRCQNELIDGVCNRTMIIVEGKTICFFCNSIKDEYDKIAAHVKQNHLDMPMKKLMNTFERKSLMNEDLKPCTINGYHPVTASQAAAKKAAIEYVKNFDGRSGILFFGSPGAGKSHLLSGMVKGIISTHQKSALFITLPRLLTEIKGTFGDSEKSEFDILKALYQVDLLVIDELGGERENSDDRGKAWGKSKLNEIVDARAGKATCFSSNYKTSQLISMYGERDFSRMVQYAEPVEVVGPNKRLERFQK